MIAVASPITHAFMLASPALPTPACSEKHASALTGTVHDSTGALIPGAIVTFDGRQTVDSGSDGTFTLPCALPGSHRLYLHAEGFTDQVLTLTLPQRQALDVTLRPAEVQTSINVQADDPASTIAPRVTVSGDDLQSLADDPDDLLREIQQLGATSGGSPENTTITINGFQGQSKLPPKSSIAYIEVEPDMYSAEYGTPPYDGGRVNVYTKPGQTAFHGALFATNSSPWENARDPFSTSKAPLGKQRYGFDLTGPLRKQGSDFALDLEHRAIDDFAVVNAVTVDPTGNTVPVLANVPATQALWEGQARVDWQLGAKNTAVFTYSANVNSLQNVGVGGTVLAESGYNSAPYEHTLRFSDLTTVSPHLVHEARLSLRWDGETDTPASLAPQINIAGSYTAGGATLGPQQLHEFNLEADDDAIFTLAKHNIKFGTQFMLFNEHQQLTTNFNGTYTFGGGVAPVLDSGNQPVPEATETISGIEQYRRALLNLPGGTPTAFSNVAGTPGVHFNQVQNALYLQDSFNPGHGLHFDAGVRYALQNDPTTLNAITPRAGVIWSPGKNRLSLHARAGLFGIVFKETDEAEILREDGIQRISSTIYNPTFNDPFANATPIHSERQYSPHISNVDSGSLSAGGTYNPGFGFSLSIEYGWGRIWNDLRTKNINAPLNGLPTGPRALGLPNLDLLQMQNSAQDRVSVQEIDLEQTKLKHLRLYVGAVRVSITGDADNNHFFTPQSSFSDAGEFSRITSLPVWYSWGSLRLQLPAKINFYTRMSGQGDNHFNLTTGFDNNGDGDFDDRPMIAAINSSDVISTKYGLLTAANGIAVSGRNQGVLPWSFYVDSNLERPFLLTRDPKAEHQQTLTVNVRSANILNHTNITAEGSVLGSPNFGVPYAADTGRRIEVGLRYSF